MTLKGLIKKGMYYDSVSLMRVSKEINESEGVIDASVVMGTNENKAILNIARLLLPEFENSSDTDLLVSVKAKNESLADKALAKVDGILNEFSNKKDSNVELQAASIYQAVKMLPGANLALISIAGKYATCEAFKALQLGLHVMIFSDNVSIEDELKLKTFAREKGLLVMGPDCGTAIINGIPLAFANVVNKGNIGLVAASGTGLQEVSSIISNLGGGISQAIGTGGRDVKEAIGGIMFIESIKALKGDPATEVIVLISKPPDNSVLQKINDELKGCPKPIVSVLLGGDARLMSESGAYIAGNLEEAAYMAFQLSMGDTELKNLNTSDKKTDEYIKLAKEISAHTGGKYIRGLYSGGTLCDEAQLILKDIIGPVFSNTPIFPDHQLGSVWKSKKHTMLDLGDDEFTTGRPHPIIDFSLRNKRMLEEAVNPETAVILFDVVLGYGSHMNPVSELVPVIRKASSRSPNIVFICSVTGTEKDPQNRTFVINELEKSGVRVMPSNVAASMLAGFIVKYL
ncbi:MAG: acyl-CoA synthetase FdrA [Bacteroidales bacterium]|nr:acyl-CoA synthetase FdrA [Bacteroidales bacterium]